jgi:hypothetical protein
MGRLVSDVFRGDEHVGYLIDGGHGSLDSSIRETSDEA